MPYSHADHKPIALTDRFKNATLCPRFGELSLDVNQHDDKDDCC